MKTLRKPSLDSDAKPKCKNRTVFPELRKSSVKCIQFPESFDWSNKKKSALLGYDEYAVA
jgi:hypothetical protein